MSENRSNANRLMICSYSSNSQSRKYVMHSIDQVTIQRAQSQPGKLYPQSDWCGIVAFDRPGFSRKQASLIVLEFGFKVNCFIVYVYGQE